MSNFLNEFEEIWLDDISDNIIDIEAGDYVISDLDEFIYYFTGNEDFSSGWSEKTYKANDIFRKPCKVYKTNTIDGKDVISFEFIDHFRVRYGHPIYFEYYFLKNNFKKIII